MTLLARINRLFKADVHAVLDSIEEPTLLLQQSIREMENALGHTQDQLVEQANIKRKVNDHLKRQGTSIEEVQQEIDLCLTSKNDDLAKELLRKKITLSRHINALQQDLAEIEQTIELLSHNKDEQTRVLTDLQGQADLYACAARTKNSESYTPTEWVISDADLEIALLKEKQRFSPSNSNKT